MKYLILIALGFVFVGCNPDKTPPASKKGVFAYSEFDKAVIEGNVQKIEALHKANVEKAVEDREEIINDHVTIAIRYHNFNVVKLLIEGLNVVEDLNGTTYYINVNGTDSLGNLPLYVAIEEDQLNIVKLLIKNDAWIFLKNSQGYDAIEYAELLGHEAITTYLKERQLSYSQLDGILGIVYKDNEEEAPYTWTTSLRSDETKLGYYRQAKAQSFPEFDASYYHAEVADILTQALGEIQRAQSKADPVEAE